MVSEKNTAGAVNDKESSQLAHLERAFKKMGLDVPGMEEARNLIANYLRHQAKRQISPETLDMCRSLLFVTEDAPIEDVWAELVDIEKHGQQLPDIHPEYARKIVGELNYSIKEEEVTTLR